MKRRFLVMLFVLSFAAAAHAAELNVADLLSDAGKYVGKQVIAKGSFLYSEAPRESFTMAHDGVRLEVFYRDLPPNDKLFILSQAANSKTALLVSGTLKQYANKERAYFMDATSLRYEGAAAPAAGAGNAVSYIDILSQPGKYLNRPVTMKGAFVYSEPMRQSFTFEQNGKTMEVLLSDLSKADRERVLDLKKNSKTPVVVTGVLQNYANDAKRFFITALSVFLEN